MSQSTSRDPQMAGPTVLLVEDDPSLGPLLERVLTSDGYRVIFCADGLEALHVLEDDGRPIDLLLSDVNVPRLSGDRLTSAVHRLHPTVPVVLMTGFTKWISAATAESLGACAMLLKPMSMPVMLATVRDALANGSTGRVIA